jgi:hypothetical protein
MVEIDGRFRGAYCLHQQGVTTQITTIDIKLNSLDNDRLDSHQYKMSVKSVQLASFGEKTCGKTDRYDLI